MFGVSTTQVYRQALTTRYSVCVCVCVKRERERERLEEQKVHTILIQELQ